MAHKILNWRINEEATLSDHNLILFSPKTRNDITQLNRTTGLHTRKYATQASNWYSFKQGVLKHCRNWEDHINKAQTKAELDTAINTNGEICRIYVTQASRHSYRRPSTFHGGPLTKHPKKTSKRTKTPSKKNEEPSPKRIVQQAL